MKLLSRHARWLLVVYLLFLAVVLFSPSSNQQSGVVARVSEVLVGLGLDAATPLRMEVVLNALMIAPVSFLGMLVYPATRWRDWLAFGFIGSSLVELTQGLFLPDRSATYADIVANTAGALLGAIVVRATLGARRTPGVAAGGAVDRATGAVDR